MVLPVNIASEIADVDKYLQDSCLDGNCDAGFGENGKLKACTLGPLCPNIEMYGPGEFPLFRGQKENCCRLGLYKRALLRRDAMLEFYWNSSGKTDSLKFLKDSGLVTRYR